MMIHCAAVHRTLLTILISENVYILITRSNESIY